MSDEHDEMTPRERRFVENLRSAPAVAPSSATRDRIAAADEAVGTPPTGRRWAGQLAAAAVIAAVGVTFLFPPTPSSAPARMTLAGAVLDAGPRTSGLARLAGDLEVMERKIR